MDTRKLIFLIDDEPDFVELMKFMLENFGFKVASCLDPEEALKKVKELKPDLVLLDLNMPKMNGHEVCKHIKEDKSTLHIPVVMLTSQERTIDKVQAFNLGVCDYINKNFPAAEILIRIRSALKLAQIASTPLSSQEKNDQIMLLRKVIDEKNIRTLYQPIVRLSDVQHIGYEALARGPQGTLLENPLPLFALATEAGMSYDLDTLCLELAAKRAQNFLKDKLLFLNTDPSVINTDYFRDIKFLEGVPLPPAQICVEITERTYISNFNRFNENLNKVKPLGIMIVIDDLGEGYASLKAIAEFKPAYIKIDMGLVRNVHKDAVKQSICQVIVELSAKIGSKVIAEGVETEEEYKTLQGLKVEFGQGFLFGKPAERE